MACTRGPTARSGSSRLAIGNDASKRLAWRFLRRAPTLTTRNHDYHAEGAQSSISLVELDIYGGSGRICLSLHSELPTLGKMTYRSGEVRLADQRSQAPLVTNSPFMDSRGSKRRMTAPGLTAPSLSLCFVTLRSLRPLRRRLIPSVALDFIFFDGARA